MSDAGLPGDRTTDTAPVHGCGHGQPVRPPQRPQRDALPQWRHADTPRGDRARVYERFDRDGYWATIEKSTGEFLGWFGFHPTEGRDPDEFELGYRLRTAAWGKGYATEGSRALIRTGFTDLGVRRVWAQTMAVNTPSRRVMEKAGLTYVRTFHEEFDDPLPGTEHGEVEYALTKADWDRQQAGRQ